MAAHTCYLSTQEAEAGGSTRVQGQPGLHSRTAQQGRKKRSQNLGPEVLILPRSQQLSDLGPLSPLLGPGLPVGLPRWPHGVYCPLRPQEHPLFPWHGWWGSSPGWVVPGAGAGTGMGGGCAVSWQGTGERGDCGMGVGEGAGWDESVA